MQIQTKIFIKICLLASISCFSVATAAGWSSPSIPILLSEDSPIPISKDQGSSLIVVTVVGVLVFVYPVAIFIDVLGRKLTILLGMIPILLGWLMIALADRLWMLFLGRVFFGIAFTFIFFATPIYLGEISSDCIRGFSITTLILMNRLGILFMFSLAPFLAISTMAWIGMIPPLIFISTFIWMPESPYFLIGKNKRTQARRALVRLRGHDEVDEELDTMVKTVMRSMENRGTLRELASPENRKGLVNVFTLSFVCIISGTNAIQDYSQYIFSKIENDLEPYEISIILAAVSLMSVFIGNLVVDRLGRKPLLLISVTGCACCNTIVSIYFNLSERHGSDVSSIGWLPICALMFFKVSFNLGLGLVTLSMLGEIFPKHLKAIVGASFVFIGACLEIFIVKLFQSVTDNAGGDVSFGIFAVCLFAAIPFIVFQIPETKGKSLDEIQDMMRPKAKENDTLIY